MPSRDDIQTSLDLANKATEGPWEAGDYWHIQGDSHCPCKPEWGPAHIQTMEINGEQMLAHRHRRKEPLDHNVIQTFPYEDGFPRAVVITTEEYGTIDLDNSVFIAHARTAVPVMAEALLRVLELHQPDDIGCCQGCGTNEWGDSLVTHSQCPTVQAILGNN